MLASLLVKQFLKWTFSSTVKGMNCACLKAMKLKSCEMEFKHSPLQLAEAQLYFGFVWSAVSTNTWKSFLYGLLWVLQSEFFIFLSIMHFLLWGNKDHSLNTFATDTARWNGWVIHTRFTIFQGKSLYILHQDLGMWSWTTFQKSSLIIHCFKRFCFIYIFLNVIKPQNKT